MAERNKPDSFLGWLGRQIGFVHKAIKTDVTPPATEEPKVVYRNTRTEEAAHPHDPDALLRRTTVDEIVVKPEPQRECPNE